MLSILTGLALGALSQTSPETPLDFVKRSLTYLGGYEKISSIRTVKTTVTGHSYMVEQSERPTGPYLVAYSRGTRAYDFKDLTEISELTLSGLVFGPRELKIPIKTEKGTGRTMMPMDLPQSYTRICLGPERALIMAAAARDLSFDRDATFNGIPHRIVRFRWGTVPVRLFLRKDNAAPSAVETTSVLPFPWDMWGDVTTLTRWSNWELREHGVMEPCQFTTEMNGYPVSDETVLSAEVTLEPSAYSPPAAPSLPVDNAKQILTTYKQVPIADGITMYQGRFNTFVIEQPDGLVVIEPVIDPSFATEFLDMIAKSHPGTRVKAVVATDDAWPHCGGIRTFAARGCDLVILDRNRALMQRFCDAPHLSVPDELQKHPAKPRYKLVAKSTSVGTGPNRLILYPIAGQGSERMLMVYFPERRLLYGSDLLQRQGDGFFFPSYPKELVAAVRREHLNVERVFAEHLGPTPWSTVTAFVEKKIGD